MMIQMINLMSIGKHQTNLLIICKWNYHRIQLKKQFIKIIKKNEKKNLSPKKEQSKKSFIKSNFFRFKYQTGNFLEIFQ